MQVQLGFQDYRYRDHQLLGGHLEATAEDVRECGGEPIIAHRVKIFERSGVELLCCIAKALEQADFTNIERLNFEYLEVQAVTDRPRYPGYLNFTASLNIEGRKVIVSDIVIAPTIQRDIDKFDSDSSFRFVPALQKELCELFTLCPQIPETIFEAVQTVDRHNMIASLESSDLKDKLSLVSVEKK